MKGRNDSERKSEIDGMTSSILVIYGGVIVDDNANR